MHDDDAESEHSTGPVRLDAVQRPERGQLGQRILRRSERPFVGSNSVFERHPNPSAETDTQPAGIVRFHSALLLTVSVVRSSVHLLTAVLPDWCGQHAGHAQSARTVFFSAQLDSQFHASLFNICNLFVVHSLLIISTSASRVSVLFFFKKKNNKNCNHLCRFCPVWLSTTFSVVVYTLKSI